MSCPSLAVGKLIMFFLLPQVNAIGTLHCGVLFQIAKIITCIIQTLKKGPADYKVIIYCTCLITCVRSSMPGKKILRYRWVYFYSLIFMVLPSGNNYMQDFCHTAWKNKTYIFAILGICSLFRRKSVALITSQFVVALL